MPRSVNSVAAKERKKNILKHAKGFFGRRKNVWTVAKNAVEKAWQYAYTGRKLKKRDMRTLWIARINAAVREYDLSYSKFINLCNTNGIVMNRKALADLALNHPEAFKAIVEKVKSGTGSASKSAPAAAAKAEKVSAPKVEKASVEATEVTETPAPKAKKAATTGDDLKVIEGIGPKIEELLHAKGITTFAQVVETPTADIQAILDEAGSKFAIHDPATWAEQATLLRDGKMDEFNALAEELKGGKRVD